MAITTDVVSSNLDQGEMYNIATGRWFLWILRFPPQIKLTATI